MIRPLLIACTLAILPAACSPGKQQGAVTVSVIGDKAQLESPLAHIDSPAARLALAATAQGLVSYDGRGDVVPALAQRWMVIDEGRSYIFRLRRARWTNGDRVDAREVARLLRPRIRAAASHDPFGSLAAVTDVIAMTADVLEIRLSTPRPSFLAMLAQPEMAIARSSGGTGPYRKTWDRDHLHLTPILPETGGHETTDEELRRLHADSPARAIARFSLGYAQMVTGGSLNQLPYLEAVKLDRKAIRFDPVNGLFGLTIAPDTAMLQSAEMRTALAMAIDTDEIVRSFAVPGWKTANSIIAGNGEHTTPSPTGAWHNLAMSERRARAAATVTAWKSAHAGQGRLSIAISNSPGEWRLYGLLRTQLARIGLDLVRSRTAKGDLRLIDEVAPYPIGFWYLGHLSCKADVSCDPRGDALLHQAAGLESENERARALQQAETLIAAHGGYIPIASPVRWSLVSQSLTGFTPSPVGLHPLASLTPQTP